MAEMKSPSHLILKGGHLLDSSPVTCRRKQKEALGVLKHAEALRSPVFVHLI